jgi:hypothetical protein
MSPTKKQFSLTGVSHKNQSFISISISISNMNSLARGLGLVLVVMLAGLQPVAAKDLGQLKVLYIGEAGSPRSAAFNDFLKPKVGQVEIAVRWKFKPEQAADFDVVLLDWPQSDRGDSATSKRSPLGDRQHWTKPTVLLGSAGLNLAIVWEVKGGFG